MSFPPRTCTIRPNGHAGVGSRTRSSAESGSREGANSPTDSQPKSGHHSAKGTRAFFAPPVVNVVVLGHIIPLEQKSTFKSCRSNSDELFKSCGEQKQGGDEMDNA